MYTTLAAARRYFTKMYNVLLKRRKLQKQLALYGKFNESHTPGMKVYHGTDVDTWNQSGNEVNFQLYVATTYQEAEKYSEESGWGGWEEGDKVPTQIVVEFDLDQISKLPGVERDPDWGWLEGSEWNDVPLENLPNWEESMNKIGSFAFSNFRDEYKKYGQIHVIESLTEGSTTRTVYHVTDVENVPKIQKAGLVPMIGPNSADIGEPHPAVHVFLTKDALEEAVMNWDMMNWDDGDLSLITLEIPTSMIHNDTHLLDAVGLIYQTIPPSMITSISEMY